MDYIIHGVAKSRTQLSDFHSLDKKYVKSANPQGLKVSVRTECLSLSLLGLMTLILRLVPQGPF